MAAARLGRWAKVYRLAGAGPAGLRMGLARRMSKTG